MNRMRFWRAKKMSQEAGRLTQICVWAPEQDAELVRKICTRVAEPTARGQELRGSLIQQLDRRRTIYAKWSGFSWEAEFDYPFVGPWWYMRNIGGRVTGPGDTLIELSPEEAEELKDRLKRACSKEIESWVKQQKLTGCVRDNTGVITDDMVVKNLLKDAPERPADEAAFAANEARIARSVTEAARRYRKPPLKDPSVVEYEGIGGFPSFCQVAHRRQGDRVQFALIHMANGGTSPTNMFEALATYMRQRFYPDVDASHIDWFDVFPPGLYRWTETVINAVTLQQANGIYSDPDWSAADISDNWAAFINQTIARGQKARSIAEAAPHDENTSKKPVAR